MPSMPAVIVLIVCRSLIVGEPDQNAGYTGHENREWALDHNMMVCRRHAVPVADGAEFKATPSMPVDPQPFNIQRCQRSGIMMGSEFDAKNRSTPWRFWRVACPVKIVNTITGEIIGWQLPDCGHRQTVRCEGDISI